MGKVQDDLLLLTKFSFWMEDWGQVHNSVQFGDFLEIHKLPNINRRLLLLLIITFAFTRGKRKVW